MNDIKLTDSQRKIIQSMREGAKLYRYRDVWELDSEIVSKIDCMPLVEYKIIEVTDWKVTYSIYSLTELKTTPYEQPKSSD